MKLLKMRYSSNIFSLNVIFWLPIEHFIYDLSNIVTFWLLTEHFSIMIYRYVYFFGM